MLLRSGITASAAFVTPTFIGSLTSTGCIYPNLGTTYGYMSGNGAFKVYNLSTMAEVGNLSDGTNLNGSHDAVPDAAEAWAFCACEQGASLTSINLSDKANPVVGQRYRGPSAGTSLAGANPCKLDGTLAVVPCFSRNSIAFIDITDPTNMAWLSEFRGVTPGTTVKQARRVSLDTVNKVCYYACDSTSGGVHRIGAIDYTNPASPVELWSLSSTILDTARGVFWDAAHSILWAVAGGGSAGDITYDYKGAVIAYSVDTGNLGVAPTKIGQFRGNGGGVSNDYTAATAMTAPRSIAFVQSGAKRYGIVPAESPNNLTVLDVTDPANMQRVGYVKDTAHLNAPMGIEIGPDGYAHVASLFGTISMTKWDLHIP